MSQYRNTVDLEFVTGIGEAGIGITYYYGVLNT
jgi:hypothetical protein